MFRASPSRYQGTTCPSRVQHRRTTVQIPHNWATKRLSISTRATCKEAIHSCILSLRPAWPLRKTIDTTSRGLAIFQALTRCLSLTAAPWLTHTTWGANERRVMGLTMINWTTVSLCPASLEVASLDLSRQIQSRILKLCSIYRTMVWIWARLLQHIL